MELNVLSSPPDLDPQRPLLIVDVDEVLGLFVAGFARFVAERGYELRLDRFALLQNLYRPGDSTPVDLETGKSLYADFFRLGVEDMQPTPHAVEALAALAEKASVVILTNAPDHCRAPRGRWLAKHGMNYPMLINEGPKGYAVAALAAQTQAPSAFVDDLLSNLDSAQIAAPAVHRFQLVADPRIRALAPAAPDRHRRIDSWPQLQGEIAQVLGLHSP